MLNGQKQYVVVDTNVWLSGLVFGGRPGEVLKKFADGDIIVVISEECLSELRRKITEKFPLFVSQLERLEASLRKDAVFVPLGAHTVNVSRDQDDNKFIETALAGNCQYLVSGDRDLLDLRCYGRIQILTPAEFLDTDT